MSRRNYHDDHYYFTGWKQRNPDIDDMVYTDRYRDLERYMSEEARRDSQRDWAEDQNYGQDVRYHDNDRNRYYNNHRNSYYDDGENHYHGDRRNSYYNGERHTNDKDDIERESPKAKVYHDQRFGRDQHRFFYEPVFVLVEHWSGCVGQNVCDNLQQAIRDHFDDQVDFATDAGPFGSFEVYINGKLLYSRIKNGGYPYENDVILAIDNVRNGRNFSELRHGVSRICVIL